MSKKKSVKKMTVSKGVEKKNLDEFDVTDGKERGKDDAKEEKELDDLLGGPQMNPYGTLSKEVLQERLDSSSASELKDLANRVGIPMETNSDLLKQSLLKSFESYAKKQNSNDQATSRLAEVLKASNEDKKDKRQKDLEHVKELEQLLGMPQMNPYGTLNRDIFRQRLDSCSAAELTDLAVRVSVPRERNMNVLRKSLLQSFDFYAQKHNVTVQGNAKPIIDPSSPDYEKTVKLFRDL